MSISEQSILYIKKNQKLLISEFASKEKFPLEEGTPTSVFMAGSPGAGKTEVSKRLIENFEQKPVRIDADEIRSFIPEYTGDNSDAVQGAASLGVEKLYDACLKNNQNLILDGTFADYRKARLNIQRSIGRSRIIRIIYVYQDPLASWEIVQKRQETEGRIVPKDVFIKSFFSAQENVNKIKEEFGTKVVLDAVIRHTKNDRATLHLNVQSIDNFVEKNYNASQLKRDLK